MDRVSASEAGGVGSTPAGRINTHLARGLGAMGIESYWYFVNYESDIDAALRKLRLREFKAGRYNPVIPFPKFPVTATSPAPGAKHSSIDEALEASGEDGTRSILDIIQTGVASDDYTAGALSDDELISHFGTTKPTREMLEANPCFYEGQRGTAVYVIVYKNDKPNKIFFAGCSFD
jgi:hypothetical protein